MMLVFPNAKINLGLNIVGKRNDGFHDIESIMLPVQLCDILEFTVAGKTSNTKLNVTGLRIDSPVEENLILKAYHLLDTEFKLPPLNIHLHKVIPFGAGLGGGSSDASFFIKSINEDFSLGLSNDELRKLSGKIGSDCPFFIENKPVYVSGRGDVLQTIEFSISGYYIVLVVPTIKVNTREAYSGVTVAKAAKPLSRLIDLPVKNWKDSILNDFETTVFNKYPEIKSIKEKLYTLGAEYASMTGSGSAVFAIFNNELNTAKLFNNCFIWQEYI